MDNSQNSPSKNINQPKPASHQEPTSGQLLFVKTILVLLLFLIGGLYIFSMQNNEPQEENVIKATPTPAINLDQQKKRGLETIKYLRAVLGCQRSIDNKYPKSLFDVKLDCFPKDIIPTPPVLAGELTSLNYMYTNKGKGYYFEMPVVEGQGYIVTRFNIEYITIPKDSSIEKLAYARDATRISLLTNLAKLLIENKIGLSGNSVSLCNELSYPCFGDSRFLNAKKTDGTGWVKINIKKTLPSAPVNLPVDSLNDDKYHFVYCADNTGWEVNAALETGKYISSAQNDNGDDKRMFEAGTNLQLINNIPGCEYKNSN